MMRRQDGFTVPELLIMMVVTTILTVLVLSFTISYWGAAARLENDSSTLVSRLNAGDALRDQLNVASGLISQNSISDTNAGSVDQTAGPGYWTLLHAVPGTVTMPSSGTIAPVFYYQAPSTDASRNFIMNGSQPYSDEFVLYLDGSSSTLKLRRLINPSAAGDRLTTTCPPAQATATCPADKVLAENVSSVDTRYFSRSGNTINYQSQVELDQYGNPVVPTVYIGPDFPSVEVVELTVHLFQKSMVGGAANTSNETIVRVALRNG
ncbi:MAG: pilus assembly FimT family protein [Candidatus Saccharimonadales bacterium]